MKEVELKLLSELMKNSRRSDRELAKAMQVSQPTVTRIRNKLEKEGIIKEYTIIPDFNKLEYEILALTFIKLKKELSPEETEKARKEAKKALEEESLDCIMAERGIGLGYDGAIIALHKNYAAYLKAMQRLKEFTFLEITQTGSFLINLNDETRYRPLTFSTLAKHLLMNNKQK